MNRDAQFFFNFAHDCFFGGFALLHFAAGEFPAVFVFAVAALCGKNLPSLTMMAATTSMVFIVFVPS